MRNDILKRINEIIKEDFPCNLDYKDIKEDDLLSDSNMDSFGYSIFWLNISDEYNILPNSKSLNEPDKNKEIIEYVNNIDYKTYKVKDLIDRILECI